MKIYVSRGLHYRVNHNGLWEFWSTSSEKWLISMDALEGGLSTNVGKLI
jgi:hypothetical protein|nr:MAG TPA: hypothetical protein [Caudoviricetes sp.]